jgi:hypothetical protein
MTVLPRILPHLVYESGIILVILCTLFIVSNSVVRFPECVLETKGLDFQLKL